MTQKSKLSLSAQVLIGLFTGAILGIIINLVGSSEWVDKYIIDGAFDLIGSGFIRAMQMLVVPLVFASLVTGAMSMGGSKELGSIGVKTIIFFITTTSLAIIIALTLSHFIQPGKGMDLNAIQMADIDMETLENVDVSLKDTLLTIIPTNPIKGMAEGDMLQIIFFAVVLGGILAKLGERASFISNLFNELNDVMMEMTLRVMKFAPIGVFALISRTFSQLGFKAILDMLSYVGTVFLGLGIHLVFVYLVLLVVLGRLNPFTFLKKFAKVMNFTFSTASSNASIPLNIETLTTELGVDSRVASFTIPLGATINMDGTAIMQGVAVVFVANAYNIPLGFNEFLTVILAATLASVGTAGIPSVGLITLSMVFNSVGLPVEGIAMIMGIDRILDMARSSVNITGDAVCTLILSRQAGLLDEDLYNS